MKKMACLLSLGLLAGLNFANAQAFTSSNLPIVVINTGGQTIPDDPKIEADMGVIYNGPGVRNNLTDPFNNYNGKIGIETRGHSSQMFPMKSYGVELHDASGNSVDQSILGMPKESDWVLYAPYTDKTLMRNFLAYTLSRQLGHWAANCQFVEVVLNGDYIGVYLLEEKIKRNKNRVNITKMSSTDVSGDNVTGGYIFSLDKDPNAWISPYNAPNNLQSYPHFSYVTPKVEDIVLPQQIYIEKHIDSFERALHDIPFSDTLNGYRHFIDVHSFMDYFFINEVSRNVDGYRLSSYFYKDRDSKGGKIVAGPVWDYDLAFRNANYCNGSNVDGWAYNFNYVCPTDGAGLVPFWWEYLMRDTAYEAELRCRWKDFRQTVFSLNNIDHLIDSVVDLLSEAEPRHFKRWPILGTYVWPNPDPIPPTYDGEISALKSWIQNRLQWLDVAMPNQGACSDYPTGEIANIIVGTNPNPFSGTLILSVDSRLNQSIQVEAYDMTGKILLRSTYPVNAGRNTIQLPTFNWSRGEYILRINSSSGDKMTRRVLKTD